MDGAIPGGRGSRARRLVLLQRARGAALQVRLYAEDPARGFRPGSGVLSEVRFPSTVRVDTWIETGSEVSPYYDPMLAKLISHAPTREAAIAQLRQALEDTSVYGIETNLDYLRQILRTEALRGWGLYDSPSRVAAL